MKRLNKIKRIKALVITLELLTIALIIYLVVLPIWPALKYKLVYQGQQNNIDWQDIEIIKQKTNEIVSQLSLSEDEEQNKGRLQQAEYEVSPDRVIIAKIGVNAPIVEGQNGDWALSRGAWRLPESSTPDQGGNTVITGHRFKYLPPSNLTFYLFHKLAIGDIVSVIWQGKEYYYKIKLIKIVAATDFSVLEPTTEPTLTLFTCDPIYSQKNRLVVVSELIEE